MTVFIYKLKSGELSRFYSAKSGLNDGIKFYKRKYKDLSTERSQEEIGDVKPRYYVQVCNLGLRQKGKLLI